MAQVVILVGTLYGNAMEAARACADVLRSSGHRVLISDNPTLADIQSDPNVTPLICTSTTGVGDLPDSIMPLYCELLDDSPNLYGRQYGLIGLGDSSYDVFNGGSKRLKAVLDSLGAECIGEPLFIDGRVDYEPEKPAAKWVKGWAKLLR
ncbi:MAG TPA: flavodoxin domain-containing protein [Marinobacterium sp.]|nr:flavodoxin domain-containing protein [Marinobacterium sp.]